MWLDVPIGFADSSCRFKVTRTSAEAYRKNGLPHGESSTNCLPSRLEVGDAAESGFCRPSAFATLEITGEWLLSLCSLYI